MQFDCLRIFCTYRLLITASQDSIKFLYVIFNTSFSDSYLFNTYYLSTRIFRKNTAFTNICLLPPNPKFSWFLSDENRYCRTSSSFQDFITTLLLSKQRLPARATTLIFYKECFFIYQRIALPFLIPAPQASPLSLRL